MNPRAEAVANPFDGSPLVPDPADEAIRDFARARDDVVNSLRQVRQQLKGFLLRYYRRYGGKTSWCAAHDHWLARQSFEAAATQTAFTEYWHTVKSAVALGFYGT